MPLSITANKYFLKRLFRYFYLFVIVVKAISWNFCFRFQRANVISNVGVVLFSLHVGLYWGNKVRHEIYLKIEYWHMINSFEGKYVGMPMEYPYHIWIERNQIPPPPLMWRLPRITQHINRLIPQWFLDNKYTVYQIYIKQHNIKLKFEHKQILIICYVVTCTSEFHLSVLSIFIFKNGL